MQTSAKSPKSSSSASSKNKSQEFSLQEIFTQLPNFEKNQITELFIHDENLSSNKNQILKLISQIQNFAPNLFVSLPIQAKILDQELLDKLSNIYCSLEIPLVATEKITPNGTILLFDKKLYSRKANLLNNLGLVFGFNLEWGLQKGDTFKSFRERLDFATSLYPNHITFAQLSNIKHFSPPKPTGIYSSKDLDFSRGMAFACKTFYSAGRAVPWFNSVISALRISPSSFFADFEEWQQCNNCSFETDFNIEETPHSEIEKMQLLFLREKFEEKHKISLFTALTDIVKLNGALSRATAENQESIIETSYNPDDIFSPASSKLEFFTENVTMENCTVKIFITNEGFADYKILNT